MRTKKIKISTTLIFYYFIKSNINHINQIQKLILTVSLEYLIHQTLRAQIKFVIKIK